MASGSEESTEIVVGGVVAGRVAWVEEVVGVALLLFLGLNLLDVSLISLIGLISLNLLGLILSLGNLESASLLSEPLIGWFAASSSAPGGGVLVDGGVVLEVSNPAHKSVREDKDLGDSKDGKERGAGVEVLHGEGGVKSGVLTNNVGPPSVELVELVVWEESKSPVQAEGTNSGEPLLAGGAEAS